MTTGPACVAPEEGAESGEHPPERPNKLAMETGSGRPNVKPKRQRMRNGEEEREKDRQGGSVRTICSWYRTSL